MRKGNVMKKLLITLTIIIAAVLYAPSAEAVTSGYKTIGGHTVRYLYGVEGDMLFHAKLDEFLKEYIEDFGQNYGIDIH